MNITFCLLSSVFLSRSNSFFMFHSHIFIPTFKEQQSSLILASPASGRPGPGSKAAGGSRGPGSSAAASREHARAKEPSKCMVDGRRRRGRAGPLPGVSVGPASLGGVSGSGRRCPRRASRCSQGLAGARQVASHRKPDVRAPLMRSREVRRRRTLLGPRSRSLSGKGDPATTPRVARPSGHPPTRVASPPPPRGAAAGGGGAGAGGGAWRTGRWRRGAGIKNFLNRFLSQFIKK